MMQLRPYQQEATDAIDSYFIEKGGNPLIVIPTGGGKSLIIATYIQRAMQDFPDTRILILTHSPELIEQNYAELIGFWHEAPAGIYSAKLGKRHISARVLFAGIQSIHRKAYNLQKVDLVLIDEAHLIPRKDNTMYRRFLADLLQINPYMKIVGFTATPFRMDSGMLHRGEGAIFDDIAYDANIRDLIEAGYLSTLISRPANRQIDLTGVGTAGGDFIPKQLEAASADPETIAAIADEILANSAGRNGILYFGSGIGTCTMMCEALRERDISCETIFGETPNGERKSILSRFKAGQIRALSSMGVLTTGFNAKHVDMIALGRATKSTGLYIQIVGRGTRLFPGKDNCLILDFGSNIARHGPIDAPIERKEKVKKDKGVMPEKKCIHCEEVSPISARECIGCGMAFPEVIQTINTVAAALDIMSNRKDLQPQWIDVNNVFYYKHTKIGSPDSLRVTYQCGLLQHSEWVCLAHSGGIKQRAVAWWNRRAGYDKAPPSTVADALLLTRELRKPTQIAVRPSGKYTEIVGHKFEDAQVLA